MYHGYIMDKGDKGDKGDCGCLTWNMLLACLERTRRFRLPVMSMCADPEHMDIPVPDFTWEFYPDAGYVSDPDRQLTKQFDNYRDISSLMGLRNSI